ncbi:MAG: class I SAM-dependent methyltransferase, partial [Thiotrichaceae bacterium]
MNQDVTARWDNRYKDSIEEALPCSLLSEYGYFLPKQGLALDLACGMAGNAFYLADKGLQVHAVDISPVAIKRVNEAAQQSGKTIE